MAKPSAGFHVLIGSLLSIVSMSEMMFILHIFIVDILLIYLAYGRGRVVLLFILVKWVDVWIVNELGFLFMYLTWWQINWGK